jgi:protein-S-isoprenylcysteine O-methyltransferase Ste14
MSWVTFWKFLHIACMFGAVALFVGTGILNNRVQQSKDVRAIRAVITAEGRLAPIAGVLMLLGIVFGFVTAVAGGFDLLAPWLLITYGLVLAIILTGALYHGPHDKKLKEAVIESEDDQPSGQLLAIIGGTPGRRVVNVIDSLLWAGLIFVMVVKPFGLG